MSKSPKEWQMAHLIQYVTSAQTLTNINGRWMAARPLGCYRFSKRLVIAWRVFTGKCDAVQWPGDQRTSICPFIVQSPLTSLGKHRMNNTKSIQLVQHQQFHEYERLQELVKNKTGVICTIMVGPSKISILTDSYTDYVLARSVLRQTVSKEIVRGE